MWDKYIREQRIELEHVLSQKCYWWIIFDAFLCISIKGKIMKIKLPLPSLLGNSRWHDEWKYKDRNEAEIKRVRDIWQQFTSLIEEKLQKIETGQSTVEEEVEDGIFFEDGKYGLKYRGGWI